MQKPKLTRTFSFQIMTAFCGALVLSMLITAGLLRKALKDQWVRDLTTDLFQISEPIASEIADPSLHGDSVDLVRIARRFGHQGLRRVSLIRSDGVVVADSDVPLSKLKSVENHLDRPEVQEALKGNNSSSVRFSHTVKQALLYTAVPLKQGQQTVGIIRISVPLEMVDRKIRHLTETIFMVTGAILILMLLIALVWIKRQLAPLNQIVDAARRLSERDYGARVRRIPLEELDGLGRTINLMAQQIQDNILELSNDKMKLESILANLSDGIGAVDIGGRILFINQSLRDVLKIGLERIEGIPFLEVIRNRPLGEMIEAVLEDQSVHIRQMSSLFTENHFYDVRVIPLIREIVSVGAMFVIRDTTELRRLEEVRREFVANVSHELRTPLTAIKGFAETLRGGAWDDKAIRADFVKSIENHADRMRFLVDDLLDLAAIESGKRSPQREPVPLLELIKETMETMRPMAEKNKIKISIGSCPPNTRVKGDRGQLKQVFSNILDNAIKFNKTNGSVTVSFAIQDEFIEIKIQDTGCGIPSDDLPRIFERFYRVERSRSRELGGTGLGLAIVKHIVENHGGSVLAESELARGSSFIIRLPLS